MYNDDTGAEGEREPFKLSRRAAVAAAAGVTAVAAPKLTSAAPTVREIRINQAVAFQSTGVVGGGESPPPSSVGGEDNPPASTEGGGVVGGVSDDPVSGVVNGEEVIALPATGTGSR